MPRQLFSEDTKRIRNNLEKKIIPFKPSQITNGQEKIDLRDLLMSMDIQ